MLPIKMPNGDTPMQYPFPYKNASGEGGSQQSTNPTFVATTTQSLLVTGNAEVDGVLTVATLVADTVGGQRFVGQQNVNSGSITSQTNTSTGNAAFGAIEAKNNTGQILGMYMYGSNHATKPNFAEIQAIGRDLNILASTVSIDTTSIGVSQSLQTNGSKQIVGVTNTGTGNNVMSASPTLTGTLNCAAVTATGVVSGSKFRGEESAAGFSSSYQKNSNSAGSASIAVFNNADSDLSLSISGTTSSNKATISTNRPLEIISDSTITLTGTVIANSLSPSLPVSTDGSKNLVSASVTGSGSTVLQTSPTLITPTLGAATGTSLQLSGLTASQSVHTDASKNLVSVVNTGSGNNVMSASPTLTGTLNCGPVVSTGTVSGTGYVGNSTGLASAGNIGEITTTAQTTALTNGIHYYTFTGTANTTSWADVVTGPTLTPGLYACHAQVYVDCQTANRLLQWNFAMGGTRCFGPWVMMVHNVGYVSAGFTKIIRVTANAVITLQGVVNSAATLVDSTNCICITRIG